MKQLILFLVPVSLYCAHEDLLEKIVKTPIYFTITNELKRLNVNIQLLPAQSEQLIRSSCGKHVSIEKVFKIVEALSEPINPVAQTCEEGYKMLLAEIFLRYQSHSITSQVNQLFLK